MDTTKLISEAKSGRWRRCLDVSPRALFILSLHYLLISGAFILFIAICYLINHQYFHLSSSLTDSQISNDNEVLFHNLTYIRAAYRISDSTIRLVIVRSVKNKRKLTYEFGLRKGQILLECHNEHCPDVFSPPCSISGYVGIINDLSGGEGQSYLVVYSEGNPMPIFVDVIDSRKRKSPTHQLGVCLQPIYAHTDYAMFAQFFEYWLSENATKFYVYRESYTPEVGELLDFYRSQNGISVEIVDWSALPESENGIGNPNSNPNRFWFRLEVFIAIFDCVHRARWNVKYLAQTDLDEMLYVGKNRSVLNFMRAINAQEPEMASVSFRSQRIKSRSKNNSELRNIQNLTFSDLESVMLEKKVFDRPLYTKMVYRPERVFHVHIHRQLQTEVIPNSPDRRHYKHVNISPNGGVVLHIRRLSDMYQWTNSVESRIIADKAIQMTAALKERGIEQISLFSNGIRQFYSSLNTEERKIVETVEAESEKTDHITAYRIQNADLGDRAEKHFRSEAERIIRLDLAARNFYLSILQMPNRMKEFSQSDRKAVGKAIANEKLHQFEKLDIESQESLQKEFPEVVSTLKSLIPSDLTPLNGELTSNQEKLLRQSVPLLGEGEGKMLAYLRAHDQQLAKKAALPLKKVEKKLGSLNAEGIGFVALLLDYLRTTEEPSFRLDGTPNVPKEIHGISLVSQWSQISNGTKLEIQRIFPNIYTTLQDGEFEKHTQEQMDRNGWVIN